MTQLESLEADLVELTAIDAEVAARRASVDPIGFSTPLSAEWDALTVQAGMVMLEYYELNAGYDPRADYEEQHAVRLDVGFSRASSQISELLPLFVEFRERHADALGKALALREEVPTLMATAEEHLTGAAHALGTASAARLTDRQAWSSHATASQQLAAASNAAKDRKWVEAHACAEAAVVASREASERADALPGSAKAVRTGALSARTRRDAQRTRHEGLPAVMSQLRRKYTYDSWQHIENAPRQIDFARRAVDDGLTALDELLRIQPLDVPAAAAVLASVRAAAGDVDAGLQSAVDLLVRLDAIAADPEALLSAVRRKTIDARRFLSGLPASKAERFTTTFNNISARTDQLAVAAREERPNWGALAAEADAVELALDAMINSARTA